MNTQIHCSSAFKRFANASQADMAKIGLNKERNNQQFRLSSFGGGVSCVGVVFCASADTCNVVSAITTTILASTCIFLYFLTQHCIAYIFVYTCMIHQILMNCIKWFNEMLGKVIKTKRQAEAKIVVVIATP